MAEMLTPDICVIGGGPGGVAVAVGAARRGVPVVLVEKGRLGGAYLNGGGVASKAFLAAAEAREWLRRGPLAGVTGAPLQVNLGKVRDHVGGVTEGIAANMTPERLTALGVTLVEGAARFVDRRTVEVADTRVRPRRFVLAVGARHVAPKIAGLKALDYLTPEDAFDLGRKPNHVLVLGASGHGLEIAQAYSRLGIDASLVDTGPPIPDHDPEHADIVIDRLRTEGVRFRTGVAIRSVAKRRGGVRFQVDETAPGGKTRDVKIDGSHLIVTGQRAAETGELGLDVAGIDLGSDGIAVDARLRTANRRVYAIGDAVAGSPSVSRARLHAATVLRTILFRLPTRVDDSAAVRVVHTDPAIAAVGWSEGEARFRGQAIRILRFPFNEVDRARIERSPYGVVKIVASIRGRVLGATVVGAAADELIAPWSLAVARRLPIAALADLQVAVPSLSQASVSAAATFVEPDLTPHWRQRIIKLLRRFG